MSLPLIIRPEAEADLAKAKDWYDGCRPGLGDEFLLCAEDTFARIRRMPKAFAVVYKRVRIALIRRFPYLVCYRVKRTGIEVLVVSHGSQDWGRWQSRV